MVAWRLLNTGFHDGAWNMAVDEALWRGVQEGKSPPALRFYAWTPATLSVGYAQPVERDIDLRALERLGIPWVRRPTGGRAVLHGREITYSAVFPADVSGRAPREAGGGGPPILRDYAFVSGGLVLGLRNLGVPAELAPAAEKSGRGQDPGDRTGACFSSTSAYEVTVRGRKIAGSAQRRGGGGVLQHGSVPLDLDVDLLASLFKVRNPGGQARLAAGLREKVTCVREALGGREVSYEEACAAFASGFRDAFGELVPGELTPEEREAAEALVQEDRENREKRGRRPAALTDG